MKKLLCILAVVFTFLFMLTSCKGNERKNTQEPHTHSYSDWETVKNATCIVDGVKERYCSCGEKQVAGVAVSNHNFVYGICSMCGAYNGESDPNESDESKYNRACALISSGNYEAAYTILLGIQSYSDAKEKLSNFFYAPTKVQEGHLAGITGVVGMQMVYDEINIAYDTLGNIKSRPFPEYNDTYNYVYDATGNELQGYDLDSPNSYSAYHTNTYQNGKLSKVSYRNDYSTTTYEYFYNSDNTVNRIVCTYTSGNNTRVTDSIYTYTYYDNSAVKSLRYTNDDSSGIEYQYNANGEITAIYIYDSEFEESYAYITFSYDTYGISKCDIYFLEDSDPLLFYEVIYIYDSHGRLIETRLNCEGELYQIYIFSEFKLCYSENSNAKNRVAIITKATPEEILAFID